MVNINNDCPSALWAKAQYELKQKFGEDIYNHFLKLVHFDQLTTSRPRTLTLTVATQFSKIWVRNNYYEDILEVASTFYGPIEAIKFTVRTVGQRMAQPESALGLPSKQRLAEQQAYKPPTIITDRQTTPHTKVPTLRPLTTIPARKLSSGLREELYARDVIRKVAEHFMVTTEAVRVPKTATNILYQELAMFLAQRIFSEKTVEEIAVEFGKTVGEVKNAIANVKSKKAEDAAFSLSVDYLLAELNGKD